MLSMCNELSLPNGTVEASLVEIGPMVLQTDGLTDRLMMDKR